MKKLQAKYECFNTISKTYNLVWQLSLCLYCWGYHFIQRNPCKNRKTIFDNDNSNYFAVELHQGITSINDITGQKLDENECCGTV